MAREESVLERIVSMLCFVIAFFESRPVRLALKGCGVILLALGAYAFTCAVMGGAAILEILIGGAVLIAFAALLFRGSPREKERNS